MRRIAVWITVILVCLCGCRQEQSTSLLEVHVLALGDASCVLLRQGEHAMLVDAGDAAHADRVVAYLHEHGVEKLQYILQTYPSPLRIGGMERVIQAYDTEAYLHAPLPARFTAETPLEERLWDTVGQTVDRVQDVRGGMTLRLGEATVEIYPTTTYFQTAEDYALACRVSYGDRRFLLFSQTGEQGVRTLVDSGADLTADVVLLPQNGNALATTATLLGAVSPEAAVIACAGESPHPHADTLHTLQVFDVTVWRTDYHGNVVLTTDGGEQDHVITTK